MSQPAEATAAIDSHGSNEANIDSNALTDSASAGSGAGSGARSGADLDVDMGSVDDALSLPAAGTVWKLTLHELGDGIRAGDRDRDGSDDGEQLTQEERDFWML